MPRAVEDLCLAFPDMHNALPEPAQGAVAVRGVQDRGDELHGVQDAGVHDEQLAVGPREKLLAVLGVADLEEDARVADAALGDGVILRGMGWGLVGLVVMALRLLEVHTFVSVTATALRTYFAAFARREARPQQYFAAHAAAVRLDVLADERFFFIVGQDKAHFATLRKLAQLLDQLGYCHSAHG